MVGTTLRHPEVSKDARAKSRAARIALIAAVIALAVLSRANAASYDAAKRVPPQSADALQRLAFLAGTWRCTDAGQPTSGHPWHEDVTYSFLPGGYWLEEDTVLTDGGTRVWNHALYIGHDDEYSRRPGWIAEPFAVRVAGDDTSVPAGQSAAGWDDGSFKIFDQYGGVVTLRRTGTGSIEWRYEPRRDSGLAYYPHALRKCTR